ncbi:hypothetical protein [Peribacillus sp. SCS-155]
MCHTFRLTISLPALTDVNNKVWFKRIIKIEARFLVVLDPGLLESESLT